jgi:hypothetical protein
MKKIMVILLMVITMGANAQSQQEKPCSAPEASQFDFWVSDWKLTWN